MKAWRLLGVTLGVVALLLTGCGGDDAGSGDNGVESDADAALDGSVEIRQVAAGDNFFDPTSLKAPAGAALTINFANEGSNPHSFTIDEPAADTGSVGGGDNGSVVLTMPDSDVTFYCKIHGQGVMSGTISVQS